MSGPAIVIALLAFALAAVIWQASRALRHASEQVDHILDATRTGHILAAPDNKPGSNLADHDECALILHTINQHEATFNARCDRLLAAIRDEQQKGDTA